MRRRARRGLLAPCRDPEGDHPHLNGVAGTFPPDVAGPLALWPHRGGGTLPGNWAGHSLRRGMITTALDHGVAPHVVQGHARHRSIASTLDYGETGQALARHPDVGLGAGEGRLSPDQLDAAASEPVDLTDGP